MTIKHSLIVIVVFLVISVSISLILLTKDTIAEVVNGIWSWSSTPIVFSSTPITDTTFSICPTPFQIKKIEGELKLKKVCFTNDQTYGNVSFGTVAYEPWRGFIRVVGFKYDSKMYVFHGPCDRYDSCLYMPGSDTLVTKQYLINGFVRSLVVYRNFKNRLTRVNNGVSTEYDFDSTNPDYTFKSGTGYAWPIGGFGAADDGKWLAVEFRERGIGLLNMATLEMKRVSTMSFSYGTGYDPTAEIAVSNGGKQVAVMGANAGFAVFDVDSGCGDIATDERMSAVMNIVKSCKKSPIDVSNFIYRFSTGIDPKFNDDGGELNFYATSYTGEAREVILRAAGNVGQKLDYLALGDSFTSGEGETDDKFYLPGTNDQFEKCHLSTRSYPYVLAGLSGIDPELIKSVACSGAKTDDIVGSDSLYNGQGGRLDKKYMNSDQLLAKTQAKYSYIPGRIYQEIFVTENAPQVITIGVGGNDAGLMAKLTTCASSGTCNWANSAKEKEQTALEIKNIFGKLVHTYKKIHEDSPNSKIYVIGYPNIIDASGKCDKITGFLFDNTEKEFIFESVTYLNQVVKAAAKSAGVMYIDVQGSYGNQALCGSESPNAISGVRTGDDSNLINDSDWFKFIGNESFHPNSIGHSLVAKSIHKSVDDLSNYSYCNNGVTICPDDSVSAPEPSSYWIADKYHDYPTQQIASFVYDHEDSTDNKQKDLIVDSYSLLPNSSVNIEITSDPISLGNFTAGSDGSLSANLNLPVDLMEGYHTLHLYGTSYSGEQVELYQVIKYEKPYVKSDKQISNISANIIKNMNKTDTITTDISVSGAKIINKDNPDNIGTKDIATYSNSEVKGVSTVLNKQSKTDSAGKPKGFSISSLILLVAICTLSAGVLGLAVIHSQKNNK
jgi:lysophospholipase L1-like esterase